jgi:carboxypeptidase Taq
MGFDFKRGRVDRSSHPFTLAAGTNDVRLTLRFDLATSAPRCSCPARSGHGLYDQISAPT